MKRALPHLGYLTTVFAMTLSPAALGEVSYTETDDDLTIVRMTVTPAAEPVPALKFRVMEREIDLKDGNAAPFYYRALFEAKDSLKWLRTEFADEYYDWHSTDPYIPISQLPLDKLRKADQNTLSGLIEEQLHEATSRASCDWEIGVRNLRGPSVIDVVLDEFQSSRELCRLLATRTRLKIAERDYIGAINAIRMNYRLGRDVASVPFLVCGLIGIAEAGITNNTVCDLIASPDSPNLYWALTELPEPIVDMRPAARFEIDFGPRIFPFIHHAETTDHSPQEWNRLFTQSLEDLHSIGDGSIPAQNDLSAGVAATAIALVGYPHAKARLIADGFDSKRVEQMSIGQVMAIYTDRNYQLFSNDFEKLWYVPFWEMRSRYEAVERKLERARFLEDGRDREVLPIVSQLLPAMHWARAAQVRLEREIAGLRIIEALRMYAASHAGGLPKSLDEITEVPIPLNPATGKPFVYRLEDRTAILELPKSDGIPGSQRRYEIEIDAD